MEFSDSDEEIIDLNRDKQKSKDNNKKEKLKIPSNKDMKWVRSSLECISQMAISDKEENEDIENNKVNQENEKENQNENQNKESTSDNNNYNNNNFIDDDTFDNILDYTAQTDETNTESNSTINKSIYTFIWDEGGNNVKLIGSFSNWKEEYKMEKDEKSQIYKFSLQLNNDKYQYKYIVDGIWKYSKKQKTIDDGRGNINNILDLTDVKQKEEIKNNISNKRNNKNQNKNSKKKEKNKKRKNTLNKEENKFFKKREYGNDYPNYSNLSEPNNSDILSEAFNINNESKQKKLGLQKYYKYKPNNSYSSNKSYLNISNYRHTILNHILLQKEINKKNKDKIGISFRYREKAITLIYFN